MSTEREGMETSVAQCDRDLEFLSIALRGERYEMHRRELVDRCDRVLDNRAVLSRIATRRGVTLHRD